MYSAIQLANIAKQPMPSRMNALGSSRMMSSISFIVANFLSLNATVLFEATCFMIILYQIMKRMYSVFEI